MPERRNKLFSLPKLGARHQFFLAIVLISVMPILVLAYVVLVDKHFLILSNSMVWLMICSIVGLMVLGYGILFKYPSNIAHLHKNLEEIVKGQMPDSHVVLMGIEDDIGAIEKAVNVIIDQLRERIDLVEKQKEILERELCQANKLKAIGAMASGIAHEINTPVQFVSDNARYISRATQNVFGFIRSLKRTLETCEESCRHVGDLTANLSELGGNEDVAAIEKEVSDALSESLEGLDRIASIVRAMRGFAYMGKQEKVTTDINKIIENAVTMSRHEWKHVAEIEYNLDPALPGVECIPGDIMQVLLNIIVNAAHAVRGVCEDGGGMGRIIAGSRTEKDQVAVTITDTGGGIPEKVRDQIFEPFFTTKKYGDGTGQGLAISRSIIINKHGGSMTFETEKGKGTTFIIRLPVRQEEKSA